MPMVETFDEAFGAHLVTFSELRILQVLADVVWYDGSESILNLRNISARLKKKCKARRGKPKRGFSRRHIRRCLQHVEDRFQIVIRQPRFERRACNKRQTSNVYDVRGLAAFLEQKVLEVRTVKCEAPKALAVAVSAKSMSSHVSTHMSALETVDLEPFDHELIHHPSIIPTTTAPSPSNVIAHNQPTRARGCEPLTGELLACAVLPVFAWKLVTNYSADVIRTAIRALEEEQQRRRRRHGKLIEHPGKWLYRAITEGWELELEPKQPESKPEPVEPEILALREQAWKAGENTPEMLRTGRERTFSTFLERLRKRLKPQNFATWFAPPRTRYVGSDGAGDYIEVPNRFFREWINEGFKEDVAEAAGKHFKPVFIELPSEERQG